MLTRLIVLFVALLAIIANADACTGFGPTLLPMASSLYLAAGAAGVALTTIWNIMRA
jgi:hypothetical protein